MNWNGTFIIQTSTVPLSRHQKLTKHGRCCCKTTNFWPKVPLSITLLSWIKGDPNMMSGRKKINEKKKKKKRREITLQVWSREQETTIALGPPEPARTPVTGRVWSDHPYIDDTCPSAPDPSSPVSNTLVPRAPMVRQYLEEISIPAHCLPCVILTLVDTHLNIAWRQHSSTRKDKIEHSSW